MRKRLFWAMAPTVAPPFAADRHWMEGAAQSPVRVIVYEDLPCPDCAGFRTMLDEKLLPRYSSTVRFEHRDFPLSKHAWARQAATAARYFEETRPGLGLAHRQEGVARGIAKTPAVLVNDRPFIETFAIEDVAKAIEAELAAAK